MLRAAIFRLESYTEYVAMIKSEGRTTVTSEELANVVGISSSRVRQDLVKLNIVGKPRTGYSVNDMEILLYCELGLLAEKGMALVGCGNLGRALAQSGIWSHVGFDLRAILDTDDDVIGQTVGGILVRPVRELHSVIESESIVSACLTVPASAAQSVANMLVAARIKGIWNFAPVELDVPRGVIVENQRLEQGLMTLSYLMTESGRMRESAADRSGQEQNDATDGGSPGK